HVCPGGRICAPTPYGSEGGGLTALLEGMAMARPLVVTERAILRDDVTDGTNAIVVPPKDPAALREAIEQVCSDLALAAGSDRPAGDKSNAHIRPASSLATWCRSSPL